MATTSTPAATKPGLVRSMSIHGPSSRTTADEIAILRRLWREQVEHNAADGWPDSRLDYLRAHFAMDITLRRHIDVVDMMAPYIRGRVLEWGCRHALDSCLYRLRFGDAVELHGCDLGHEDEFRPFHRFSGLLYRPVRHDYLLDYDDATFDVVTSNGVLEHVPDDARSVAEVARVLRPGGTFLVTCLPNRYSYTEAIQRLRGATAHDRLYTQASARALLESAGFEVSAARRFLMVPTMLNGFPDSLKSAYQRASGLVRAANALLEHAWPLNLLASNLMLVARKPG